MVLNYYIILFKMQINGYENNIKLALKAIFDFYFKLYFSNSVTVKVRLKNQNVRLGDF